MSQLRTVTNFLLALSILLLISAPLYAQSTESETETADTEGTVSVELIGDSTPTSDSDFSYYEIYSTLDRVHSLIELGTVELAYQIVVEERPNYEYTVDRDQWEKLFFELAWQLGRLEDLISRTDDVEESDSYSTYVFAQSYAVKAEILLGRYEDALYRLRQVILRQPENREALIELRRLIAQIYLEEGSMEDAEIAMSLFDRDYRPSDPEWEHRFVRVLFRSDKAPDAMARLAPLQTLEGQLLNLYGQFNSQSLSASDIVATGLELQPQFESEPALNAELWALINAAARVYNDLEIQTIAVESALSIEYKHRTNWEHLSVVPLATEQQLLDTYRRFAIYLGNDIGLIIGDDESWYQLAQEFEITSPTAARAVHAYLATNSQIEDIRNSSTAAYANSLFDAGLYRLLDSLFVRLNLFDISKVPLELQTRLTNVSLRQQDYEKALAIIDKMPRPQEPDQLETWLLRQARLAIAVFDFNKGEMLLNEIIENLPLEQDQETIDRIVQIIFDIQEQEQHELAIRTYVKLYNRATRTQTKREILRWISESYSAQGNHARASDHLLRSAQLGGQWDDEWALSSRLKAADEFVNAGFIEDARSIYSQLHEDTIDPRNRSLVAERLNNLPKPETTSTQ